MITRRLLRAVLLAVPFALPTTATAADAPAPAAPSAYLGLKAGLMIPLASDLDGFDNGFAIDLAFGYAFNRNFALEASVGQFKMSGSETDSVSGLKVSMDISAVPILLTAKGILPAESVDFYALAGFGSYIKIKSESRVSGSGSATDETHDFGFHLGAGFSTTLKSNVMLGLELRYFILSATLFDYDGDLNSLTVQATAAYRF